MPVSKFFWIQAPKSGSASGICDGIDAAFDHAGLSSAEWRDQFIGWCSCDAW